ncbi:MAG TPA: nitrite reductase large subunit NirB [Pseudomonadales bacterium]|jgi:nitrite reductase (NADH) large subunit|nr:nitrite reductase large subunit NirB [Pseudomonadales bacterium]HJP50616.1 nitrite reductase large subunit NirB [Pseudomonadales bacterium]
MSEVNKQIVVVGNGMVGHHYVEKLLEANITVSITVIGGEPRPAYDRVHLSDYFAGKKPGELALTTREHYRSAGVSAFFGDPVAHINRDEKTVRTRGGRHFPYDNLVLATGSYPFVPSIPGTDLPGCLTYRTIDDLGEIKAEAKNAKVGVVVGGGLLGLEAANALKNLGLETHVVEFTDWLMGVQIDDGGSKILQRKIEALGVQVHVSKETRYIKSGKKTRLMMEFADGNSLGTDMIIFSAGIRPHDQLAREAEISVGEQGGIIINEQCKTSDDNIFAIGECALYDNMIFGLVAPGNRMAEAAVSQLTETKVSFKGADMSTKLKLLGVDVGSIGDAHGTTSNSRSYVYSNEVAEQYKKIVVTEDHKKLLGAVLVGDCEDYGILQQLCVNQIGLPDSPETLILPKADGGQSSMAFGVENLPDTALICTCNDVSKVQICSAVKNGTTDLATVKSITKASTTCGGCTPLVSQVMNAELMKLGVEVNNYLCEHFEYSRPELFDILRNKNIKTFSQLLSEHGQGHGCEVCKATVGSMLASLFNDYVLKDEHIGLQDTNDVFLGNMQKDGTYSVVPRIPGGEITPDKLILLGEVAKQFDLYTKITGGQRIDMFGAQLHELPQIWKLLVDAGFETGHAYGKAVRTVKSCVGTNWCRFGVQNSVAMSILVENRYRGIRSPHKIKMAVSGCARECAEAQSKDIGIIATENGWNMYVCGNGGMRPRHADLFATDLDDVTLIKYIDRFLMFYIRTAEKLQRTSVWLENFEGGLDHIKSVVIDDELGIGGELEQAIHGLVDTYRCEWKTTLDDPVKLLRFQHFINSEETDQGLSYIYERGQRRPVRTEDIVTSDGLEPIARVR